MKAAAAKAEPVVEKKQEKVQEKSEAKKETISDDQHDVSFSTFFAKTWPFLTQMI